jgi:hypothetical protein
MMVGACVELRNAVNISCRISDKYYVVLNLVCLAKHVDERTHVKDLNAMLERLPPRVSTGTVDTSANETLLGNAVRRLNGRGLTFLTKAVQKSEWSEGQTPWKQTFSSWACASERTLERAARCPMVLLDFNFQRVSWWSQVVNSQPREEARHANLSAFQTDEAIPLAHDLLLEAWSAARSMPPVSSLVFGMAPEVTTLIARLSPRELDRVVLREIECMGPRWGNRPMFWKELLQAATQLDDQILANVYLHCLQLLGGELASTRSRLQPSADGAKEPAREASIQER